MRAVLPHLESDRDGVARHLAERCGQIDDGAFERAFEHKVRPLGTHVRGDDPVGGTG